MDVSADLKLTSFSFSSSSSCYEAKRYDGIKGLE